MNTAVVPVEPDERAAKAIEEVNKTLVPVLKLDVATVVAQIIKYADFGKQAVVQADKALINSDESYGKSADLMKAINANLKTCTEDRMAHTKPFDEGKKYIMKLFGAGGDKLAAAKDVLQGKQNAWVRAEHARKQKEAEEERKRIEAEALARAEVQASLGDNEGADQVIDEGAQVAQKVVENVSVLSRGDFGALGTAQTRYEPTVTNPAEFLKWVLENRPTELLNIIEFRKSGLNVIAKQFGEAKKTVPGLTIDANKNSVSR